PDAAGCIATLQNVARSSERQKQLVANARRMYQSRFEPSQIHAVLLRECEILVRRQRRSRFLKTTITRSYQQLQRWRLRQSWLREMRRHGLSIHKSIELTGRADVTPW